MSAPLPASHSPLMDFFRAMESKTDREYKSAQTDEIKSRNREKEDRRKAFLKLIGVQTPEAAVAKISPDVQQLDPQFQLDSPQPFASLAPQAPPPPQLVRPPSGTVNPGLSIPSYRARDPQFVRQANALDQQHLDVEGTIHQQARQIADEMYPSISSTMSRDEMMALGPDGMHELLVKRAASRTAGIPRAYATARSMAALQLKQQADEAKQQYLNAKTEDDKNRWGQKYTLLKGQYQLNADRTQAYINHIQDADSRYVDPFERQYYGAQLGMARDAYRNQGRPPLSEAQMRVMESSLKAARKSGDISDEQFYGGMAGLGGGSPVSVEDNPDAGFWDKPNRVNVGPKVNQKPAPAPELPAPPTRTRKPRSPYYAPSIADVSRDPAGRSAPRLSPTKGTVGSPSNHDTRMSDDGNDEARTGKGSAKSEKQAFLDELRAFKKSRKKAK